MRAMTSLLSHTMGKTHAIFHFHCFLIGSSSDPAGHPILHSLISQTTATLSSVHALLRQVATYAVERLLIMCGVVKESIQLIPTVMLPKL
jgi:hypothetical protein